MLQKIGTVLYVSCHFILTIVCHHIFPLLYFLLSTTTTVIKELNKSLVHWLSWTDTEGFVVPVYHKLENLFLNILDPASFCTTGFMILQIITIFVHLKVI